MAQAPHECHDLDVEAELHDVAVGHDVVLALDPDPARRLGRVHRPRGDQVVVRDHLGGSVDFSLLDAIHTNESITADFAAIRSVATDQAFYLFHDVINWNMIGGFNNILAKHSLKGKVFTRTASGMALAYASVAPEFDHYLNCFTEPAGLFQALSLHYLAAFADPISAFRGVAQHKK